MLPILPGVPGKWSVFGMELETGRLAHALYPLLHVPKGARYSIRMKDWTIIQTSEAFDCLKDAVEICHLKDREIHPGVFEEIILPAHRGGFENLLSVATIGFTGTLKMRYSWMDSGGALLGDDMVTLEMEKGIRAEWDSLAIRWNRYYGEEIAGIQMVMTRHPVREADGLFLAENRRVLSGVPPQAAKLRISVEDKAFQGLVRLDRLDLRTY